MRIVVFISLAAIVASEQKRSADPFKFRFELPRLPGIPFGIGNQKFGIGLDVGSGGGQYGVYGDYGAQYGANLLSPRISNGFFPGGLYSPHSIGKRSADPKPGIGLGLGGLGGGLGYGGLGGLGLGLGLNGGYGGGYGGYGGLLNAGNYANGYSHSSGYNHGNHILGGIGKHGGLANSHLHLIGKRSTGVDIYP